MNLKFLLVTYDFPPFPGGISRYYHEILRLFPPGRAVVWTVRNPGRPDSNRIDGIRILRSSLSGNRMRGIFALFRCAAELDRVIRKEKPDFLLCGNIRPFGPVVRLLARRFGLPFLVFIHGLDIGRALTKIARNPFYASFYRRVLSDSRWIVANSAFTRNLIVSSLPALSGRTVVIHPGVDTDHYRPHRRGRNGRHLLSVGRLTERKGVADVIRSLPLLLERFPGIVYDIVGDGEHRKDLLSLVDKLGLTGHVRFHLDVADRDLRSWYDRSDIFLMVTRPVKRREDIEGFGIVYLEAAASGLPVVASPLGGAIDAVADRKTGLLIRPEPAAIASAVAKLLSDPGLRNRLGRAGRRRCVEEFQWKHSARKLDLLLNAPADKSVGNKNGEILSK